MTNNQNKKPEIINFNPLQDLQQKGKECVLIVPQEVNGEKVLNSYIAELKADIATFFGGYTIKEATSGWVDNFGKLVEEPVFHITVTFDIENDRLIKNFLDIAEKIKLDLFQEAVYIKVEHQVYLV